jgi:O-antigen/teichoic acid export membrane protein
VELIPLSPRLSIALALFVAGLIVLLLLLPAALLLRRRARAADEDYLRRLLRNSAVPFALQIVNRAIDFGFGVVLFNVLAQQQAGLANYDFAALITTLLLATIAEWGLNIWLTREVARDPEAIRRTFGTTLVIRFAFAALVIPLSLLIVLGYNQLNAVGVIANGLDAQAALLMVLLGATVLPGALSAAVTALFLATERPIVPAVVGLLTNIVSALFKVAALVFGTGVIGVAWAALGATLLSALMFGVLLWRSFGWPGLRFDRDLAVRMLRAGFPLMLNALLLAVFFRFDIAIIRAYLGPIEQNAYATAYRYIGLTQILPPIVINAIFPMFARQAVNDREGLQRAYSGTVRLLLLIALPTAAAMTVFAPQLVSVYNADYVPLGAPALALLIWYLPLSYVNGVAQYVLIALDRPRTITFAFGLAAVFNFCTNLLLVPHWGINAAAITTVLSEVVLYGPLWWMLRHELAPPSVLGMAWRPALAALAMAAGALALAQIHIALGVVAAPLLFGALLLLLGAVGEEDRRLAQRILNRA